MCLSRGASPPTPLNPLLTRLRPVFGYAIKYCALDIGGGDEHLSVDEMDQRQGNGDKLVHSSQLGYLQSVSVVLARLTRMTTPRQLKMVKRTMVRMVT